MICKKWNEEHWRHNPAHAAPAAPALLSSVHASTQVSANENLYYWQPLLWLTCPKSPHQSSTFQDACNESTTFQKGHHQSAGSRDGHHQSTVSLQVGSLSWISPCQGSCSNYFVLLSTKLKKVPPSPKRQDISPQSELPEHSPLAEPPMPSSQHQEGPSDPEHPDTLQAPELELPDPGSTQLPTPGTPQLHPLQLMDVTIAFLLYFMLLLSVAVWWG